MELHIKRPYYKVTLTYDGKFPFNDQHKVPWFPNPSLLDLLRPHKRWSPYWYQPWLACFQPMPADDKLSSEEKREALLLNDHSQEGK